MGATLCGEHNNAKYEHRLNHDLPTDGTNDHQFKTSVRNNSKIILTHFLEIIFMYYRINLCKHKKTIDSIPRLQIMMKSKGLL
jgi:hypothetical protein